ncbi:MAG: lysophospholipid acyltransferase family protein [Candidatus Binatia bacterium]
MRAALRFDSGGWRRFAEWGSVYGPEWWKRGSPPVIAAIIYAMATRQRASVLRNQRQVRGPRSWLREQRDAYRVFATMARSMTESMEQWGPRPRPLELSVDGGKIIERAVAEGRGLIVVTGHFGSWEVGARMLANLRRPVSWVMATEPNPTVRAFVHEMRTRHGFGVLYSDRSVLSGLPVLQALRRGEVVCIQMDPWGPMRGTHAVSFCGRRAWFQLGPFVLARLAKAPLVAAYVVRQGIRRYQFRIAGRFEPRTPAESEAALEAVARSYEALVQELPEQWIMFEDVWREDAQAPPVYEMVPQASGLRRR